jgi:Uma2 family endonuclease
MSPLDFAAWRYAGHSDDRGEEVAAMTADVSYGGWASLLHAWQELDVPEGWRAEIVGEGITMTPPPGNGHNAIADWVHRALAGVVSNDLGLYQTLGLSIPMRRKLFIPDLVVVPRAELRQLPDNQPVPAERALLVVEITSESNADVDRTTKRWGYAHAPVPLYLLIDRFDEDGPSVHVFSEPENGHYRQSISVPFGKPVVLPEPIGLTLDTSEF